MRLTSLALLRPASALLLLVHTGCNHDKAAAAKGADKPAAGASPTAPTGEDLRVARGALSIPGVVKELRAGVPKEKVLAEVKERHVASLMVEANKLELAANGAGHELLAALADPKNLLSPAQEVAYMQEVATAATKAALPTKTARTAAR